MQVLWAQRIIGSSCIPNNRANRSVPRDRWFRHDLAPSPWFARHLPRTNLGQSRVVLGAVPPRVRPGKAFAPSWWAVLSKRQRPRGPAIGPRLRCVIGGSISEWSWSYRSALVTQTTELTHAVVAVLPTARGTPGERTGQSLAACRPQLHLPCEAPGKRNRIDRGRGFTAVSLLARKAARRRAALADILNARRVGSSVCRLGGLVGASLGALIRGRRLPFAAEHLCLQPCSIDLQAITSQRLPPQHGPKVFSFG